MAQIVKDNVVYNISKAIITGNTALINLILKTESLEPSEKQYWFDLLPTMTEKDTQKLFDILDIEAKKLFELETLFQREIKEENEKNIIEWKQSGKWLLSLRY